MKIFLISATVILAAATLSAYRTSSKTPQVNVTVSEGTSMSVAVSPDGSTLAIDLQGSIWTLPATGGTAKRITDLFNDARQPAWSPDGKWITFFGYRDGGYDLWAMAPDGTQSAQADLGTFDDREPAWSHDGTRVAFSSDRGNPLGSDYNIWVLDIAQRRVRAADEAIRPKTTCRPGRPTTRRSRSPRLATTAQSVWAVDRGRRRRSARSRPRRAASTRRRGDPADRSFTTSTTGGDEPARGRRQAAHRRRERVRVPRRRGHRPPSSTTCRTARSASARVDGGDAADHRVQSHAAGDARRQLRARASATSTSTTPRQALGIVRPVISPDGTKVAFAAVGDIYVMPVGGKPENITKDKYLDTDPAWSPDGSQLVYSSDKGGEHAAVVDPRHEDRAGPPAHAS